MRALVSVAHKPTMRRNSSRKGVGVGQPQASKQGRSNPHLVNRLQEYAQTHNLEDLDGALEFLRRHYPEYKRKQTGPLRKYIATLVPLVQRRLWATANLDDEPLGNNSRASPNSVKDQRLLEQEQEHVSRRRDDVAGDMNEDLTFEGFENSSDNSEGIDSDDTCKSDALEDDGGAPNAGGRSFGFVGNRGLLKADNGDRQKPKTAERARDPTLPPPRKRHESRKGRERDDHFSEEELAFDGMGDVLPHSNFLNSSLRSTYNGKPLLVSETLVAVPLEPPELLVKNRSMGTFSASCVWVSPVPVKGVLDEREKQQGESSSVALENNDKREEDEDLEWPRFACPATIETSEAAGALAQKEPQIDRESREDFLTDEQRLFIHNSTPVPTTSLLPLAKKVSPQMQGPRSMQAGTKSQLSHNTNDDNNDEENCLEQAVESKSMEASEESKLSQKHKREVDRARATNKRGKYVAEKNERRGVEIDIGVTKATSLAVVPQKVSFKNFGGIEATLGLIRELIEYPLMHSELYGFLGAQLPGGVLLHGPPGCGKTMLAHAIAVETGVPLLKMSAPEVVSGMSGESEAKVRSLFAEAVKVAPCIIFIDEIDAITPKRETAQREMERRIVAQLLICMDDLRQASGDFSNRESSEVYNRVKHRGHVVVIGATNRPDSLDPALRRPGRFDREIALGIPDEDARERILVVLASNMRLEGTVDFKAIARRTPGFVGADLAAVTTEAATIAVKRILSTKETSDTGLDQDLWKRPWTSEEMEPLAITMGDFEEAVGKVQPSAKREGFATIPDVTWNDVGSLGSVRKELEFSISRPIKYPEVYQGMGLDLATGVLLYGPPGCGKTLVAKAIANDAGANFMCVKGPELLNKFVGESERAVRQLFARARNSSPCIIFFDEIDALAPSRGNDGNGAADRVVNQLLTEMDGLEKRKNIYLIAATNRPDMVDSALLRPGRLDKLLYVPLPDPAGRASILDTLVRRVPLAGDVDVSSIGMSRHCEGFSGADLGALVREACIAALQEQIDESVKMENAPLPGGVKMNHPFVRAHHFEAAFSRVVPSVSSKDQLRYKELHKKIRPDGHINKTEQM